MEMFLGGYDPWFSTTMVNERHDRDERVPIGYYPLSGHSCLITEKGKREREREKGE